MTRGEKINAVCGIAAILAVFGIIGAGIILDRGHQEQPRQLSQVEATTNKLQAHEAFWTAQRDYANEAAAAEAEKWKHNAIAIWQTRADQGHSDAQHMLGFLYCCTKEVPHNYVEAYFWFSVAEENTLFVYSGQRKNEVAKHLSPHEKAAVEKRVKEWKPTHGDIEYTSCHRHRDPKRECL